MGSYCGNGSLAANQVGDEQTNMSEPPLTHRKLYDDIETGGRRYPETKEYRCRSLTGESTHQGLRFSSRC